MTQFQNKRFSVPVGKRDPATCPHGWRRPDGRCWYCHLMLLEEPPTKEPDAPE